MKYNNVYFYNFYGNGDVHLSRNFVKYLSDQILADNYYYVHKRHPRLTLDLEPKIKTITRQSLGTDSLGVYEKDEDLYVNVWIGAYNHKCHSRYGLSFLGYKYLHNEHLRNLNLPEINVEDVDLIPTIDFNKYNLDNKEHLIPNGKNVLFCNNNTLSGQANNTNMDGMLNRLSNIYTDHNFIVTNNTTVTNKNVISISDIFGKLDSDIIECAFVSKYCDYVIGKSSGPYTYSLIKENLLDTNKKFICYCGTRLWTYWYVDHKCSTKWTDNEHEFLNEFIL